MPRKSLRNLDFQVCASDAEVDERVTFIEYGAAAASGGAVTAAVKNTWGSKSIAEVVTELAKDDVTVTTNSDKEMLLPLLAKLDGVIFSMWPSSSSSSSSSGAGGGGGGGGGAVDLSPYPPAVVAWLAELGVNTGIVADVLAYLCSEEVGLTELSEMAELEDDMLQHVEEKLPRLKRKKLRPAIEKLKGAAAAAAAKEEEAQQQRPDRARRAAEVARLLQHRRRHQHERVAREAAVVAAREAGVAQQLLEHQLLQSITLLAALEYALPQWLTSSPPSVAAVGVLALLGFLLSFLTMATALAAAHSRPPSNAPRAIA